jgi:hypothetical protein
MKESHLCTIKTECGKSFLVRALIGGGRLIELNTGLKEKPVQVKDSYIAILQTKWANLDSGDILSDPLWIPEEEFLKNPITSPTSSENNLST